MISASGISRRPHRRRSSVGNRHRLCYLAAVLGNKPLPRHADDAAWRLSSSGPVADRIRDRARLSGMACDRALTSSRCPPVGQ